MLIFSIPVTPTPPDLPPQSGKCDATESRSKPLPVMRLYASGMRGRTRQRCLAAFIDALCAPCALYPSKHGAYYTRAGGMCNTKKYKNVCLEIYLGAGMLAADLARNRAGISPGSLAATVAATFSLWAREVSARRVKTSYPEASMRSRIAA